MTILERLGRGLIRAVVTPIMVVDEFLSPNDEVAIAREARAKAEGERDEARANASSSADKAVELAAELTLTDDRCRVLSAEVERLRIVEQNGLADDEQYQHTAATLQDRTRERDALLNASANHAAEVNALRARIRELEERNDALAAAHHAHARDEVRIGQLEREREEACAALGNARVRIRELEEQADRKADAKPAAEKCAYCLGDVGDSGYGVYLQDLPIVVPSSWAPLCREHGKPADPTTDQVRDRVALRAASCPSRRVADPLSIGCDDCEAWPGTPCRPKVAISGDSQ